MTKQISKSSYKPVGIVLGLAAGTLSGMVFQRIWAMTMRGDAPHPIDEERGWGEVLLAAAMQGAIVAVIRASIDRAGATGIRKFTGHWPHD
ncbi:DUF4235 domain-containing protein [Asanoa sp. WMMD1127]|uniref:DUF4235 domain-containing protein n=1 Tax=Asanoa sp. WMMD1127 TaxID=3016107 RepID=UPI0024173EFC|nr:DUF4235 domain-containing protein [Asanoa sp. WMMD1127]MDG4824358.1 DUF4235 domain-containing protein [Asanoa sp. WMMD1127]